MLIAHISDLHIAGPGKKTYGLAPMAENLARCVEHINCLAPRPDVVVITGDITNNFGLDEAQRAHGILSNLRSPYFVIPGNHDHREILWQVFGGKACPERSGDFLNFVIDDFDIRLIGFDSTIPECAGGMICSDRAAWLRMKIALRPDKPTIIFMHHPPVKCGVPETDKDGFIGAEILAEIVLENQNIERILCGHIHLQTHTLWHGTIVTTAPSIGMQLGLDLTQQHESKFSVEDPAYLLHYLNDDNELVTHSQVVKEIDGPYDFAEA